MPQDVFHIDSASIHVESDVSCNYSYSVVCFQVSRGWLIAANMAANYWWEYPETQDTEPMLAHRLRRWPNIDPQWLLIRDAGTVHEQATHPRPW